ncbi:MAG: insulinase family protein [Ardenticatenaceae bacterium]|nr:insulinase family protein [Ardenticatenaceae bacterium]MCB9446246.1 insulinase family protein [Ardenticatenaceae bacterium]
MLDSRYPGPESIHRYELPNGIIVLVYENFASQSVIVEGLVRAGALAEAPEMAGLASFTASLLMRGTEKRSFAQIYEDLEAVGAELGFSGGRHTAGFAGQSLVEDLDLVLDLIAQSLCYPTFPVEQVEQVRGQILTGLAMRADSTQRMASLKFYELLYAGHPYGRSSSGYPETITRISREDLVGFHGRFYGPRNMIVTIVGAIKAEEAVEKITAVLGNWENSNQEDLPLVPPAARPEQEQRLHHAIPDKSQTDIIMGLPGPLRSAPDYLDVSLMNTILGVFGMMGRIGQSVREEQGLAYYAYSRLNGGLGPSPWLASAGVAPDKVEQAVESIRAEINRIQTEPVDAEELADCQAYRTGSLPVSLETNSGLASILTDMELYDLGLDYLQRFPDLIRAITPERIQAAAQKYLSLTQMAIAIAGPA